jgi:hypothetical protein
MKSTLMSAALLVASLTMGAKAFADCPGPFLADAKKAYEKAQAAEKQGRLEAAVRLYAQAEGSVCEPVNIYEADAARRAAPLGLTLGGTAEKKGDLQTAYELYEAGGHFALADRAFMALTRARAGEPAAYQAAREHFDHRSIEAFQSNHAAAIKAAGAYRPDPKLIAEVAAMPAKGIELTVQREAAAFNEQFLRDYIQLIQSRSDDLTDASAIQQSISVQQTFVQKWQGQDPIRSSREALETLRMWGVTSSDAEISKKAMAQFSQRADQRAQLLVQKYSGAPKHLEDAIDFITMQQLDAPKSEARVAAVRAQAAKLGDEANAKKRYLLAAEYYDVAHDAAKATAARDKVSKLTMQKMQPAMDASRQLAEQMQKEYSDPAKVQAMREQAEAARKAMQEQQASSRAANKKKADDLEKELGL